ncbi:MAG: hypothetical protein ACE5D1_04795 [Fidelibacterota bacterium]
MIYFFANIGNRDIQDENGIIKRCRSVGKEHFDHYDTVKNQLTFPILRKGLDYVLEKYGTIDRVCLFYTDQSRESAGPKWESDTVWFARLLEKLIPENYGARIRELNTVAIRENPHNHDAMFTFYQQELLTVALNEPGDRGILSLAGGIPACNMALLYRGSQSMGPAARILLVAENASVSELETGHTILEDFQRQLCAGYLENFDFSSLNATLDQVSVGSPFGWELARYFHQRLTMDYLAAADTAANLADIWQAMAADRRKAFGQVMAAAPGAEQWPGMELFLAELHHDLALFLNPTPPPAHDYNTRPSASNEKQWQMWLLMNQQRIGELWLNAWIKWETGQYTDFLARLYRINEALLHWIFETETRYSTQKRGHCFPDYENYLMNEGRDFAAFLEHEKMRNPTVPDVAKLKKFLSLLVRKQGRNDLAPVKKLIDKIGDTNGVLRLRNYSIVAHGFTPVTRTKIQDRYSGESLLEDIRSVLALLQIPDYRLKVEWSRVLIAGDWNLPIR